jgi:ribosomal protein L20
MSGLRKADARINRKMLAEMAVRDPESFAKLVASMRAGVESSLE